MLLDPKRATINDVQPWPDGKFDYEVTFWLEGVTVKAQFLLHNPWRAWAFAQLLEMCEKTTRPDKLIGRNVWLIMAAKGQFRGEVVAVSKEEEGYFCPLSPFASFKMQVYNTAWQLKHDWIMG